MLTPISNIILFDTCIQLKMWSRKIHRIKAISPRERKEFLSLSLKRRIHLNQRLISKWSKIEVEKNMKKKEICKCLGNNCKIALFKKNTHYKTCSCKQWTVICWGRYWIQLIHFFSQFNRHKNAQKRKPVHIKLK